MTLQSDEVVDVTGYIVCQKIQTLGSLFYWQNVYFSNYVMLCGTTYNLMTGSESAAETPCKL
jgi:hypothetical protein